MENKFSLNGLKILPDLNGCRFMDFEKDKTKRKFATDIEDFQLVIQIIKYPTPDRVRFDIFDRPKISYATFISARNTFEMSSISCSLILFNCSIT